MFPRARIKIGCRGEVLCENVDKLAVFSSHPCNRYNNVTIKVTPTENASNHGNRDWNQAFPHALSSDLTSTTGLKVTFRFPLLSNLAHIFSLTRRPRGTSNFRFLTTMTSTLAGLRAAPMSSILPENVADAFLRALPSTLLPLLQATGFMMVCWKWRGTRRGGCCRNLGGILEEMLLLPRVILGNVQVAGAERCRVALSSLWRKMLVRPVVGVA